MTTKEHQERMRRVMAPLTNAGGEGKTWLSRLIHSIFQLLDEPVIVAERLRSNISLAPHRRNSESVAFP
ncbi:MAG: hypothetical protein K5799_04085 [Erythrobacter sp.]|nr:hypothetical protein [Erythrobacter sp.]